MVEEHQEINIFLCSSPLQAMIAWIILRQEHTLSSEKVIIFCEEDYYFPAMEENVKIIRVEKTRGCNVENIKKNISVILGYIEMTVKLWVSDILWPMNNALYTELKINKRLKLINFYDEGMVLYGVEKLGVLRYLRENIKLIIIRNKDRIRLSKLPRYPFYDNQKNGFVYAINPEHLSRNSIIKKILITRNDLSAFNYGKNQIVEYSETEKGCLILSQPFFRVSQSIEYIKLLESLNKYILSENYKKIYIKLHPSETIDDYIKYYKKYSYELVYENLNQPIESIFNEIPSNIDLIGFMTSAMMNSKKFGYNGKIISFGLDWIIKIYKLQILELLKLKAILILSQVEFVNRKGY